MQKQPKAKNGYVCMGVIAGAHGLQGEVKIKSFTAEAIDIAKYGSLVTYDERSISLSKPRLTSKGLVLVKVKEITDRNSSEAAKGEFIYIKREELPETAIAETYYSDLMDLPVKYEDETELGIVTDAFSNGAHDIIEVSNGKKITLLPFVNDVVLEVKKDCVIVSEQAKEFEDLS